MNSIVLTQLDTDEVLRYMGCPAGQADAALLALVSDCARELCAVLQPRWTWRASTIRPDPDGIRLDGGLLLPGTDLSAHLAGCDRAAAFCATLSAGVDALLRRTQSTDMARAFCLDCCAAAAVEQLCDQIEAHLQRQYPGCFFPYRYSPGYGDLPLTVQRDLLNWLDAPRRVGLCATDSQILTPRKSVTAVLGIARQALEPKERSCLACPVQDSCQYRKSGGHCGIS